MEKISLLGANLDTGIMAVGGLMMVATAGGRHLRPDGELSLPE